MLKSTFTMSIEPVNGSAFMHGFHLGTIESEARQIAEERFTARNARGLPTRSIALIRNKKIFDVFDGRWQSEEDAA